MTFELILTEGTIAFILLLLMIYFKKQTFKNLKAFMFKLLLLLSLSFSSFEIISILLLDVIDSNLINTIIYKFHFVICLMFNLVFCYYILCAFSVEEKKTIKELFVGNLISKIVSALILIITIVYIILPIDNIDSEALNFIPNYSIYFYIACVLIVFIITIITLSTTKKNISKNKKKYYIFAVIIPLIFIPLQIMFTQVSFLPFALILQLYDLYFFVENPDLEILEEITAAQGDIEQSNQTKTDFLSNMTSEIKVPMNLIVSLCDELTSMPVFNEKLVREDISQIYTSGNSLLDIVNNILDISKIETGKGTLQERDYKVNNLLTDVINIAKSKIGAKQVKLMVNVDQNISSVLNGDYSKLYQALTNIVTNAAKFTDVGKITFTLTSTKASNVENLLFKISDTGSGIKEEEQAMLFQKGVRLANATQSEVEGSGLGLAITKEYIELLGGKIWFDSQYRVGTTFYIEVPQKIVDATPVGVAKEKKQSTEKLDCSKYTVLIVDDNNLNIKVAKRLLETYKFKVESVTSGKDCVYKIKEGTHYDAIFMDHMMPEMDGIETLHVLKKLNGYELPPIIALTANAVAGMREMYLSEGFDEYLSKPINTTDLDRIINELFNK